MKIVKISDSGIHEIYKGKCEDCGTGYTLYLDSLKTILYVDDKTIRHNALRFECGFCHAEYNLEGIETEIKEFEDVDNTQIDLFSFLFFSTFSGLFLFLFIVEFIEGRVVYYVFDLLCFIIGIGCIIRMYYNDRKTVK